MARHKKPSGGLTKWFREGWVDISRKRKGGAKKRKGMKPCLSPKQKKLPKALQAAIRKKNRPCR